VLTALALVMLSAQGDVCAGATQAVAIASAYARSLDPVSALQALEAAGSERCQNVQIARLYLHGLQAARAAQAEGGTLESLVPVRAAIDGLAAMASASQGPPEIARLVLLAAAAAAQTERDEMGLYLTQAIEVERLQLTASQPGAPMISAHEAAGDLWLMVHRYEDARRAYEAAAALMGATPRITAGLARVAARNQEPVLACYQYRALLDWWGARSGATEEIAEARRYVAQPVCQAP
jgi:hypothetical protein